mmetsp:Transcript_24473/g.48749  ORF Transcript_24473/g.48749 Transcript_24473/m.48749 type:complete len:228 (-) Transcript_24473:181-864(-)
MGPGAAQQPHLPRVGSHDANLRRGEGGSRGAPVSAQHRVENVGDHADLLCVGLGGAPVAALPRAGAHGGDERHRKVGAGPPEPRDRGAGGGADPVLDPSGVEAGGGERGDGGVHAVLDREEAGGDARVDEAVEEGRAQAIGGSQVGGDRGRELAVVADEGELLAAAREGDDGGQLGSLRRLVHEHAREGTPLQHPAAGPHAGGAEYVGPPDRSLPRRVRRVLGVPPL